MDELNKANQNIGINEIIQPQSNRIQALIDILYLTNVTWLYIFSLIYPFLGIVFGIIFLTGSKAQPTKKIGRICLILGIINFVLSILILIVFLLVGNIFSRFDPISL